MAEIASLRKNQNYICKRELITRLFKQTSYNEEIENRIRNYNHVTVHAVDHFYSTFKNSPKWHCTFVYQQGLEPSDTVKQLLTTCKNATRKSEYEINETKWVPNEQKLRLHKDYARFWYFNGFDGPSNRHKTIQP